MSPQSGYSGVESRVGDTSVQSLAQLGAAMSAKLKSFSGKNRPQVSISLRDYDNSQLASYATMDRIHGEVTITSPVTCMIDSVSIDFTGVAQTYVERVGTASAVSGRTEARHQFLKLIQPMNDVTWPENKVFLAGQSYTIPFLFVVPEQLLPKVCRHSVASSHVQQEHLKLPPSFGQQSISRHSEQPMCDGAPGMARIQYAITASVNECADSEQSPVVVKRIVKINPHFEETPPFDTDAPGSDYVTRVEKDVRKGVFKGKLGRLVVETAQPRAIRLPTEAGKTPETKVLTISLRFDPVTPSSAPPKLQTLSAKLKLATFFASTARMKLATRNDATWDLHQGMHTETISLSSRCIANVDWTWNAASESSLRRRSSIASSCLSSASLIPEASAKYKGEGFYTASVIVPVSLPTNRAWVPSFHTCIISRIYGLSVHIGVAGASADLKLPLQLFAGPAERTYRQPSLSAEEMAVEAAEADSFFAPRTISPLSPELQGRSNIGAHQDAPPGYEAMRPAVAV